MKRNLKYLLVGLGMVIKLCGVPQSVYCPEVAEDKKQNKPFVVPDYAKINYEFNHYNTTNLKRYSNI